MPPLKSAKPTKRATPARKQIASRTSKGVTTSRVAIIGAGHGGTALMEIFAEDPLVTVVGVAEIRPVTRGVRLAKKLGIPVRRGGTEAVGGASAAFNARGWGECQVYVATH